MNLDKDTQTRREAPVAIVDCGLAQAAMLLGDKWTLLILREAFYDVARFDDMQRDLSIPRAVLTARLAKLVDNGILGNRAYQEKGKRLRHEYRLTATGKGLMIPFLALMQWGDQALCNGRESLKLADKKNGKPVRIGPVSELGQVVPMEELRISIPNKSVSLDKKDPSQ